MKKIPLALTLLSLAFLFSNCGDDNPAGSTTVSHIGNWQPDSYDIKQYDTNGVVDMDTTMSYKEYLNYSGLNENDEAILQITDTSLITHMLFDSQYIIDTTNYYLDGNNLSGEVATVLEEFYNIINYHTMKTEGKFLAISLDAVTKEEDIQLLGYSRIISKVTFTKYSGNVPPDGWPDISQTRAAPHTETVQINQPAISRLVAPFLFRKP